MKALHLDLGEKAFVHPTAVVEGCDLGAWTEIGPGAVVIETVLGDYSYMMEETSASYSTIGKFCSIASHACINPGNHPLGKAALHHFTYRSRLFRLSSDDDEAFFDWRRGHPVILENDVWIGHGAVILPGVRIGSGAAIGAGAVVSHDVEPFTVVAGVPAKPIRRRFDEATSSALMRIRWWDWSRDLLSERLPDFRSLSAEEFVKKYDLEADLA